VGATAKFLLLCKAVSSRDFQLKSLLEEPLDSESNRGARHMTALRRLAEQNPAYYAVQASKANELCSFAFGPNK